MKQDRVKKLKLNKETVRKLQDDDLKRVVGGWFVPTFACAPTQLPSCECLGTTLPAPTADCQ